MLRRSLKPPLLRRYNHDYVQRKKIIEQNSMAYYPPISTVRAVDPIRVPQFVEKFHNHDFSKHPNKRYPDLFSLEGKIASIRKAGKAMYFIDVVQDNCQVQVMASNKMMDLSVPEFDSRHGIFRKGDYISCIGQPSTSNVGELLLKLTRPAVMLSPCLNSTVIPEKIIDKSLINKNRVLNYLVSHELYQTMLVKSHVTQAVRSFFLGREFLEVSTPILCGEGTGANAEPFVTHSNSKLLEGTLLQLRVAPELWLKKLVISGFEKIFEIGSSFRNEGIDATHNPEFTTCEFYQSFTSLEELMDITELLFAHIHREVSSKSIDITSEALETYSSFTKSEFPRLEFIPTLEAETGVKFPPEITSESLVEYHEKLGISVPAIKSPAQLLDNLSSTFIEPLLATKYANTPVFIFNQPAALSPLAKSTQVTYNENAFDISLRFELFINGKEYVNAYEEENNPEAQAAKFKQQQQSKSEFNDAESIIPDWTYVELMKYGLPPTGGWGCGIDRLCMLLTGSSRIEEVLPFGTLKDVVKQ